MDLGDCGQQTRSGIFFFASLLLLGSLSSSCCAIAVAFIWHVDLIWPTETDQVMPRTSRIAPRDDGRLNLVELGPEARETRYRTGIVF